MIFNLFFFMIIPMAMLELMCSKKNIVIFSFSLMIMIALAGARSIGGSDYYVYQTYFDSIPQSIYSYGVGYYYLNLIVKELGGNFNSLVMVCSILSMSMQGIFFYRNAEKPVLCLIIFFALSFLWLDMVLIRQSIAAGLLLLSIDSWLRNNKTIALVLTCLATLFHETAAVMAIMIVVMFYIDTKYYIKTLIICMISLLWLKVFMMLINNAFIHNGNVDAYLNEPSSISGALLLDFSFTLFTYLLLRKYQEIISPKHYKLFQAALFLGVIFIGSSIILPVMARLNDYIKVIYILIFSSYIANVNKIEMKGAYFSIVILYCLFRLNVFITGFDGGFIYQSYL